MTPGYAFAAGLALGAAGGFCFFIALVLFVERELAQLIHRNPKG